MSRKMYGVVLWADQTDNQAVVWCEDHGDLAYWHDTGSPQHEGPCLDAGDLIQFELMQDRNLRYVRNPERVMQQHFAGLAGAAFGRARPGHDSAGLPCAPPGAAFRLIA